MDDIEYIKKALEKEIEANNEILYEKFGKEFVDKFYEQMDIAMLEAVKKQFDNFAEIRHIDVDKHKK